MSDERFFAQGLKDRATLVDLNSSDNLGIGCINPPIKTDTHN